MHAVAAAYPQGTFNGNPTCSTLKGTVSYETYVAGQKESKCGVQVFFCQITLLFISNS